MTWRSDSPVVAPACEPALSLTTAGALVELGKRAHGLRMALERLDKLVALEEANQVVGGAYSTSQSQ